jgi:hypothetical protein
MVATSEMRLLVRCLPSTHGASYAPLETLLPLDWARLVDLAGWHGMFPLFASRLLSPAAQDVAFKLPEPIVTRLKTHQGNYLHRSLTQTAALIELQSEFDRCGIKVLPWKGPSVGALLYGAPTLRESGDLDFLFLKEDLQRLLKATQSLGYWLLGSSDSDSRYLYTLALQREFTFSRVRDRLILEFHTQILSSRFSRWQDSQADIRRAATVCRLGGTEVLMQAPEDLLVSLCAHATKHYWDRLKWSCDIAQFLSVYGDKIDWTSLLARLRRVRKHSVVLLGLGLAAHLFDLSLPAAVQAEMRRSPDATLLAEIVASHIMTGSTDPIEPHHQRAMVGFLCPRLRDRIAYTMRPIVELSYEDLYIPVHHRMFFFMNYPFRIVRLLRKYGFYDLATKTAGYVRSGR